MAIFVTSTKFSGSSTVRRSSGSLNNPPSAMLSADEPVLSVPSATILAVVVPSVPVVVPVKLSGLKLTGLAESSS